MAAVGIAALGGLVGHAGAMAPASGCASGDRGPGQLTRADARKAVVCLLNSERAAAGVGALDRNRMLQRAAQRHSARMIRGDCFAHQCSGEPSLEDRLLGIGYLGGLLGPWLFAENNAWGMRAKASPRAVVALWMNSPPHRANILNPGFTDVGVGFRRGTPGHRHAAGAVYTVDFATRNG